MILGGIRILRRFAARLHSSRRGSALILAIALLVLLAVIGAAYLSLTTSERYASQSHVANVQIDLLAEGVKNMAIGEVADRTLGTTAATPNSRLYRPQSDSSISYSYVHFDAPLTSPLSDRAPVLDGDGFPYWVVSGPTMTGNFESPFALNAPGSPPYTFTQRSAVYPTYIPLVNADGTGSTYPAISFLPPSSNGTFTGPVYLAADADGDGIADTALFRLPMGTINGVTYYGGVRIVDNCSQVNANIAWSMEADHDFSGNALTPSKNYFRANIGLLELLNPSSASGEMNALNAYRFNGNIAAGATAYDELNAWSTGYQTRTDFSFLSQEDAIEHGLARRLKNPAYLSQNGSSIYQIFLPNDAAPLAYKFCLRNPNYQSTLETCMRSSVYDSAPAVPYTPDQVSSNEQTTPLRNWFNENFDHDHYFADTPAFVPVRTDVTTYSATSNAIQQPDMSGWMNSNPNLLSSATYPHCAPMSPYNISAGGVSSNSGSYCFDNVASTNTPCKIWINQAPTNASGTDATFQQFWRGFWSVMTDTPTNTHYQGAGDGDTNPYDWIVNTGGITGVPATVPTGALVGSNNGNRQFRTSIRDMNAPFGANTVHMDGFNMMLLRAALASVNAMEMRDSSCNQYTVGNNIWQNWWNNNMTGNLFASPPGMLTNSFPGTNTALSPSLFSGTANLKIWNSQETYYPGQMVYDPNNGLIYTCTTKSVPAVAPAVTPFPDANSADWNGYLPAQIRLGTVQSREIALKAFVGNSASPTDVDVTVYSQASNPYITEVYVNTNTVATTQPTGGASSVTNPKGYVAVKLYNPYPYPIPMLEWNLGIINRTAATAGYPNTGLKLTQITNFNGFSTNTYQNNSSGKYGDFWPLWNSGTKYSLGQQAYWNFPYGHDSGVYGGIFSALQPNLIGGKSPWQSNLNNGTSVNNYWWGSGYTFPVIPPYGWLVLENYNQNTINISQYGGNYDAEYRPISPALYRGLQTSTGITPPPIPQQLFGQPSGSYPNTVFWFVPNLHQVIYDTGAGGTPGGELVLLRPRVGNPAATFAYGLSNSTLNNGATIQNDGYQSFNEYGRIYDMVPVDQFDFTGLQMPPAAPPAILHYVRPNPPVWWCNSTAYGPGSRVTFGNEIYQAKTDVGPVGASLTPAADPTEWTDTGVVSPLWKFVYPGRYSVPATTPTLPYNRHEGAETALISTPVNYSDPVTKIPINLTGDNPTCGYYNPWSGIQINAMNFGGMNPFLPDGSTTNAPNIANQFPFGGFARNGDMLQIPFIGGYRIRLQSTAGSAPNQFLELNSLPMDASFADDGDPSNDDPTQAANLGNVESIGRFCPYANEGITAMGQAQAGSSGSKIVDAVWRVAPADTTNCWNNYLCTIVAGAGAGQTQIVSGSTAGASATSSGPGTPGTLSFAAGFSPAPDATSVYMLSMNPASKRMPFGSKLFDYFTCQNPANDYLPNADPNLYGLSATYHAASPPWSPSIPVSQVSNTGGNFNGGAEDGAPVYGLININTATWEVLNTLPMAVDTRGRVNYSGSAYDQIGGANARLARAIVAYRNLYGPFKTIFDLNNVTTAVFPPDSDDYTVSPTDVLASFRNGWNTLIFDNLPANDPGAAQGDFTGGFFSPVRNSVTPVSGAANGIRQDFMEQFLVMTRISNMITVRSDTYTCYVVVQGWKGVGTSTPTLAVQRRIAFLLDRSTCLPMTTPANSPPPEMNAGSNISRKVRTYNIPAD